MGAYSLGVNSRGALHGLLGPVILFICLLGHSGCKSGK